MSLNLMDHIDHKTEISKVGRSVELYCLTCNKVLLEQEIELHKLQEQAAQIPAEAPACSMDDPECLSCGS